ncbi:MAG TPA: ABC-type transport auxiliary lipoprotein family protein, partial [Thermoanaerobaculia bacterium]|nr:ABC-type transport auxiliary lipoprotein family protein [Thermoanaerobaculia bacterium]
VRSNELWSSTLSDQVLHTLAFDLADRLPAGMMILPGETKPASVHGLDIVFEQLAAGPDNKVTIDARIGARTEHIEVPITSLDSANLASGTSQALAQLADRIVATMGR